jgi:hypothetical protein
MEGEGGRGGRFKEEALGGERRGEGGDGEGNVSES